MKTCLSAYIVLTKTCHLATPVSLGANKTNFLVPGIREEPGALGNVSDVS